MNETSPIIGVVEEVFSTAGGLSVIGWALDSGQPETPVTVTVRVGAAAPVQVVASEMRRDIQHRRNSGGRHGFRLIVPDADLTTVSVTASGVELTLQDPRERFCDALEAFNANTPQALLDTDLRFTATLNGEALADELLDGLQVLSNEAQIRSSVAFTPEEKNHLCMFYRDMLQSYGLLVRMVGSAAEQGHILIKNPLAQGELVAQENAYFNVCNHIRVGCGDETFWMIQSISICNALYFPKRKVLVRVTDYYTPWLRTFLAHCFIPSFGKFVRYAATSHENTFRGLIVAHTRPMHFFHDVFFGFHLLSSQPFAQLIPRIHWINGANFLPADTVLGLPATGELIGSGQLNERHFSDKGFSVLTGCCQDNSVYPQGARESMQDDLVRLAASTPSESCDRVDTELAGCSPIVWFGVTAQKRMWLEQEEGIAAIVTALFELYPHLGVVIDGWTRPVTAQPYDHEQVRLDMKVAMAVRAAIPEAVPLVSTIGGTALDKIKVASRVDAFLCGAAGAAVFVGRIAGRRGVVHAPNILDCSKVRPATSIPVPKDKVTDAPQASFKGIDWMDYSIHWRDMLQLLLPLLPEVPKASRASQP